MQWRWDRYTSSYPYYWAVLDNVEMVCSLSSAAIDALPVTFPQPEAMCQTGTGTLYIDVVNTGDKALEDISGQPEFYVTLTTTNGAPVSIVSITSASVGAGQIPGSLLLGGSATADLAIPVAGSDRVTMRIGFPRGIGNTGDLIITRGVWVDVNPRDGDVDTAELYEFTDEDPIPIPCAPTVDPNKQLGMQVHLPILTYKGRIRARCGSKCRTWVRMRSRRFW